MHETRALHVGASAPMPSAAQDVQQPAPRSTVSNADMTRDDLTGLLLGQYALGRKIGGGGMGRVFTARHTHLNRLFAIKFIASEVSANPEAALRFDEEIKALGQLQHPHIVNAVDAGCLEGLKYLVTELVDGADLGQLVQDRGPIPLPEACALVRQAASGLAYSHGRGFLHRDIKPSNLILDRSGTVKILDFGLVRSSAPTQNMTVHGQMLGTFDFVAPEQALDAREVDGRSDLYSLGCTLLYLLSGHPPFSSAQYSTAAAKLKGHLLDQPQWLQRPPANMPRDLVRIIERLLAKSPEQRFRTAQDVVDALTPLAERAQVAALLEPVPRDARRTPVSDPQFVNAQRVPPGKQWRHLAVAVVAVCCALVAVWLRPAHERLTSTPPEKEPIEAGAPETPSTESHPEPDTERRVRSALRQRLAPRFTHDTTTTMNAAPLELEAPVPGTNRLPGAFGSAQ